MSVELEIRSDSRQARQDLNNLNKSLQNIEENTKRQADSFRTLGRAAQFAAGAFTALFAGNAITRAGDTYRRLNAQLRLVTKSTEEYAKAQSDLNRIAFTTRKDVSQLATVYNRLSRASQGLGKSQEEVAIATETIAKAIEISGSDAASANAAIIQLGQGLASGQLRGEELNSVLEQTPRLARAIADGMGVTVGELRNVAKEGKVTSDVVFSALVSQAGQINSEFKQIDLTVSSASQNLSTGATVFLAEIDKALGLSAGLAENLNSAGLFLNDASKDVSTFATIAKVRLLDVKRTVSSIFDGFELPQFEFTLPNLSTLREDLKALEGFDIGLSFNLDDTLARVRAFTNDVMAFFHETYMDIVGNSTWNDTIDGIIAKAKELNPLALPLVKSFVEDVKAFFVDLKTLGGDISFSFTDAFQANEGGEGSATKGFVSAIGAGLTGLFASQSFQTNLANSIKSGFKLTAVGGSLGLVNAFSADISAALREIDFQAIGGGTVNFAGDLLAADGQSGSITELGVTIAASVIDALQGASGGLITGEFGESINTIFVGAAIAAAVSSSFRGKLADAFTFAFTGLGQADFTTTRGGGRRALNEDVFAEARQQQNQRIFAGAAGIFGALAAAELTEALGGSDYSQVGAAIAGQIVVSLGAGAIASRLDLGAGIRRAFAEGAASRAAGDGLGTAVTRAFSKLGTLNFWVATIGFVAVLGAAVALAFRQGASDAEKTLTERVASARGDFRATALSANAGLSATDIRRIQSAGPDTILNVLEDFGILGDDAAKVAASLNRLNVAEQERINTLQKLNDIEAAQASTEEVLNTITPGASQADSVNEVLASLDQRNVQAFSNAVKGVTGDRSRDTVATFKAASEEQQKAILDSAAFITEGVGEKFQVILSPFFAELLQQRQDLVNAANVTRTEADLPTVRRAHGGKVSGRGTGTSDSILARLSNGEFVVNAQATKANMGLLEQINNGGLPGFAGGGFVGGLTSIGSFIGGGIEALVQKIVNDFMSRKQLFGQGKLPGFRSGGLVDKIRENEGFERLPYVDTEGFVTVGTGTKLTQSQLASLGLNGQKGFYSTDSVRKALGGKAPYTDAQLESFLMKEIARAEGGARNSVNNYDSLPATVQDVLIDMAYQLGNQGLLNFKNMRESLEAGNYSKASTDLLDSLYASQTPNRANRNADVLRGFIEGPGTGTSDSIMARVSNGEFIVNAKQTARFLPLLKWLNDGAVGTMPKFKNGGLAGGSFDALTTADTSANVELLRTELMRVNEQLSATDLKEADQKNLLEQQTILNEEIARLTAKVADNTDGKGTGDTGIGFTTFGETDFGKNLQENLSTDLSQALATGDFKSVGDVARNALKESIQTSLQGQFKDSINTILGSVFSSFSVPTVGGGGGGSSTMGSLLQLGIGLFSGGGGGMFGFSKGGLVPDAPGSGDRVPAMLTPGELVVPPKSFDQIMGNNQQQQPVTINISGNVDQRAIDQIRSVISTSPTQVGGANQKFQGQAKGIRPRS